MKLKMLMVVVLTATILSACGAPSSPLSPNPQPTAVTPGGGLITKPEADKWANAPQAALNARKMLVDQLKVDPDTIGLVSVEKVDWPDACLGVQTPGIACAQIITPGYKVVLEAAGKQYEFHTNESGDGVKLASEK